MGLFDRFRKGAGDASSPPPPDLPRAPSDPAAEAAVLGWFTVLLDEPPPDGQTALAAWAKEARLERAGLRVTTNPEPN